MGEGDGKWEMDEEMFSPSGAWGAHRSNVQAPLFFSSESKIIGIETPEDRNIRRKEKKNSP